MKIVLASASPRRRELLGLIVPEFEVRVSSADESEVTYYSPDRFCTDLARLKQRAVCAPDCCVIGADTVVELNNKVLGKPQNRAHAREMLNALSGCTHRVWTGVSFAASGEERNFHCCTEVCFYPISSEEIEAYLDTSDPYDKAGAYGIQSGAARFVRKICGDYYNVVGLPVSRLYHELREMGILSASCR